MKPIRSGVLKLSLVCCAAIPALVGSSSALAQRYLGAIGGSVSDTSGAKIPGASVTATEAATKFVTKVVSGGSGAYNIPALQPGTYTITVEMQGFRKETRTDVVLTAGQTQLVDFSLPLGTTTETVEVSADSSLLDTGSANISTTLTTKDVTDLPNVGRNPFVLATLAAGVVDTASGGFLEGKASQFTQPFSGVAVQISSDGSGGHNRLTLDGIPDDPAERLSGATYTGFVPSPEAVQEVKVDTSIFDAQVGHGNGTVTNTVVRTGTNKIHGAAYYVFQNTYFNANTYEKVPTQNAATNPSHRNNDQLSQTGIVVDGPVYIPKLYDGRNKTFFMAAYERYASHTAINYSSRVPTEAERAGDFSALCPGGFDTTGLCISGVQLYMPNSPVDAKGNRTQFFPDNNIASAISPAGAALIKDLPLPNVPGAAITSSANYISRQTSYPSTDPSFIVRIDQSVGSKNKLNAIYFQNALSQNYPLQGFPNGIGPSGYGYTVYRNNRGGSLDDVQQFSSSMVLDSRFGLIYHPFGLTYPGNSNFDLSTLGITSNGLPYNSFPGYTSSDSYASLAAGAAGQVSENTVGSLEEILTKTFGSHTVRFGYEGNLTRYNVQNPQSGFISASGATPGFTFDRRFTQQNSVTANVGSESNSGDPIASLLLGYPSSVNYSTSVAYALQQIYSAGFVQDDWRVNNKLTLNLGARYDYESPLTERFNKQDAAFCTTCTNPLQASVTGLKLNGGLTFTSPSDRFAYPRDLNNWQPRLGFAYEATPTAVVKGGFGIIYFNTLETPLASGFSASSSYQNYNTSAPLNSLSNPYPNGVSLPTGSSLGLSTQLGQAVTFIDPNHVQPKSAQYSLSVQQQLAGSMSLQLSYVGTRPTRLEVNHNINVLPAQYYDQGSAEITYLNTAVPNPMAGQLPQAASLNGATIARNLLLLPYPEFGSVTENDSSIGSAPYNAMQVQVNRPMKHHFSLQGNFTWDKLMLRNSFLNSFDTHLASIQDGNSTLLGNVFGTVEFPRFLNRSAWQRLLLGGWELNGVFRAANGNLISAPGSVDIIGNVNQPNPTDARYINTCYENTSGALVMSTATVPACDALSPNPAYRQRLAYTSQTNSSALNVRVRVHPRLDTSLFKQFIIREGVSFEIRGEFFNVLNTPNFGGPNTSIGNAAFGQVTLTQVNDPRIGQLTARLNF